MFFFFSFFVLGIDLVASLCEAKTKGFEVGSCEIDFAPGKMRPDVSNATADTKTAGSICLLCQVAVPVCVFGAAPRMTLTLRGGTNATQAPPIDYFVHALLPLLHRMGVNCAAKITKRGFFPKGGGEVQVMVEKVEGSLKPIRLLSQGDVVKVTGIYDERQRNPIRLFVSHKNFLKRMLFTLLV